MLSPAKVVSQAALTQELALIQGPPGTGKTFVGVQIMRLLLDNTRRTGDLVPGRRRTHDLDALPDDGRRQQLQPILVMCLTNHALDQFLQALIDARISGIVRVGGRCPACYQACNIELWHGLQSCNCVCQTMACLRPDKFMQCILPLLWPQEQE